MSAFELMRRFCPHLTDDEIHARLAAAIRRRAVDEARWHRRQWRRVTARQGDKPHRSQLHAAYRRRRA